MLSFVILSKFNFRTERFTKSSKKTLKCNFDFEASEYSLMLKLTNFVIWNKLNSFHYAGTKNLLI